MLYYEWASFKLQISSYQMLHRLERISVYFLLSLKILGLRVLKKGKSNVPTSPRKDVTRDRARKELRTCCAVQGSEQSFGAEPDWSGAETRIRCLGLFSVGCEHRHSEKEGGVREPGVPWAPHPLGISDAEEVRRAPQSAAPGRMTFTAWWFHLRKEGSERKQKR